MGITGEGVAVGEDEQHERFLLEDVARLQLLDGRPPFGSDRTVVHRTTACEPRRPPGRATESAFGTRGDEVDADKGDKQRTTVARAIADGEASN